MSKSQRRNVNGYLKRWIAAQALWRCEDCRFLVDHTYEIDHIVPLHKGGSNAPENLQLLCCACHRLKCWRELAFGFLGHTESVCARCKSVHSIYFKHRCKNLHQDGQHRGYEKEGKNVLAKSLIGNKQ